MPTDTTAARLVSAGRVLIAAHRGESCRAPENTLPAFAAGVRAGADMVELDYFHSADGVPVVFHDKDLKRTTNARDVLGDDSQSISSLTLKEIHRLDAGEWFNPAFAGTHVPSLEEALDVIAAGSVALMERKGGDANTLVDLLRRKALVKRVVAQSFDWKFVADCRRFKPRPVGQAISKRGLRDIFSFQPALRIDTQPEAVRLHLANV